MRTHLIISFYDRRPVDDLRDLLKSVTESAQTPDRVTVVINETGDFDMPSDIARFGFETVRRPNLGMNIGAWEAGWRSADGFDVCIFLQDDCRILSGEWLQTFLVGLEDPAVGLVGEALNPAWDHPWDRLSAIHAGSRLPDHTIDGNVVPRVELYLKKFADWGITPGASGKHLRSLALAARTETLERIGGFPIGGSYGECIAAEIAISRAVVAAGLELRQVGDSPFTAVAHRDWNRDTPTAPYTHRAVATFAPEALERAFVDAEANAIANAIPDATDRTLRELALLRRLSLREQEILRLRLALSKK